MGTNITGIGNANAIGFKSRVTGGIYFPPELKDALVGVWSAYGKSNDSTDRNIIKNKIKDRGGDFVISNAAFKLNSGFGKYEVDFTTWSKVAGTSIITDSKYVLTDEKAITNGGYFLWNRLAKDSFKVKISNIPNGGWMSYRYRITEEDTQLSSLFIREDGIYTLPATVAGSDVDFFISTASAPAKDWVGLTITQIPSFEGAFVTDGIDDLITSTKTVQEMLGESNEITVVSMIHQVKDSTNNVSFTNYIRGSANGYFRNIVNNYDKTGIYGYTSSDLMGLSVVNNILGDKNDYTSNGDNRDSIINGNFSVQGYSYNDGNNTGDFSSVAWYWTIIANKVLTTDQINQIIAYFNLDRTLKPDILCNTIKQGITNENHAEFGDKLIDFSGNGRDIQLNNIAWDGDSGIGKYNYPNWKVTATIANTYSTIVNYPTVNGTYSINVNGVSELMQSIGLHLEIKYTTSTGIIYNDIKQDGVYSYILPDGATDLTLRFGGIPGIVNEPCNITITQIPSHAGALYLDGVSDFGQFVGDLGLKDYTFIADRAYDRIVLEQAPFIASKSTNGQAPFLMEYLNSDNYVYPHSFGATTKTTNLNIQRQISYQSTYVYNGNSISKGTSVDTGDGLTIGNSGSTGAQYSPLCLWSLMLFPYSMSEFLIERQLKKYKLGTLYPDMVEFRPVITINGESGDISYANDKWENINIGDYINIGEIVHILLYRKDIEEISNVKVNGAKFQSIDFDSIYNHWNINIELTSKSPQKIDITIDEYIRYEDIVQPYPVLLRFNDENGNEVSWGGKLRVGSTITRIGSAADSNLLPNIYNIFGLLLNDNQVTSSKVIVEKTMVFKAKSAYIFDNNEPKCILSPRLLRIPNSSYKILGYIPDISGHGNHGVIHNSAYKLNSGANGYTEDFTKWTLYTGVKCTDSIISLDSSFNKQDQWILFKPKGSNINQFTINIKGIPDGGNLYLRLSTDSNIKLENGINEISSYTNVTNSTGFFIGVNGLNLDWSNLVIEQVGEYEGAYCLDGIDDFITIPTLSKGGKQVLMKVNWSTLNGFIYDQRPASGDKTFGIYAQGDVIAYSQHNNGNTYIDGIINNNIIGSNLSKITHNIVATCDVDNSITPSIGKRSYSNSYFAQMSLYDFMLFDEISTDDKIKELNTYIGITPKVTLPNYYWDNYGKKNTDANRGYIDEQVSLQKTGTSVNPLENFNIGYEGMSGYNGYPVVLGANKTWETSNAVDYIYDINSTIVHITNVKHAANGLLYSYVKRDGALANIKEIAAFRVTIKGLEGNSKLIYKYLATENATKESIVYLGNGIHKLPKSFVPTDALLDLTTNSWIGFAITPMIEGEVVFDCDITIEILPEYENGLAYDGVSDFTDNKNIPIFTDFTAIIKRIDLDAKNDNSTIMFKGNKIYESSIGNGFILDYCYNSKNYVYSYGKLNQIERDDSKIIYLTPESYNGNPIIKGENEDNLGLVLGKYWKGIIYKTILYSKTISLLEINFLKNLMEKDEIIDINHPIFISNTEDENNASQDT